MRSVVFTHFSECIQFDDLFYMTSGLCSVQSMSNANLTNKLINLKAFGGTDNLIFGHIATLDSVKLLSIQLSPLLLNVHAMLLTHWW